MKPSLPLLSLPLLRMAGETVVSHTVVLSSQEKLFLPLVVQLVLQLVLLLLLPLVVQLVLQHRHRETTSRKRKCKLSLRPLLASSQ